MRALVLCVFSVIAFAGAATAGSRFVDPENRRIEIDSGRLSFYATLSDKRAVASAGSDSVTPRTTSVEVSSNARFVVTSERAVGQASTTLTVMRSNGNPVSSFEVPGAWDRALVGNDGASVVVAGRFIEGESASFDFMLLDVGGAIVSDVSGRFGPDSIYSLAPSGGVFVVAGDLLSDGDPVIEAYHVATGRRSWSHRLSAGRRTHSLAISGQGGGVLAATHALGDVSQGLVLSIASDGSLRSVIDRVDGDVFFPSGVEISTSGTRAALIAGTSKIVLFDPATGALIWQVRPGSLPTRLPYLTRVFDLEVRDDGVVVASGFVADRHGTLGALKAKAARYAGCLFVFDRDGSQARMEVFDEGRGHYAPDSVRTLDADSGAYSTLFEPLRIISLPGASE